jgi:hypothetical protein
VPPLPPRDPDTATTNPCTKPTCTPLTVGAAPGSDMTSAALAVTAQMLPALGKALGPAGSVAAAVGTGIITGIQMQDHSKDPAYLAYNMEKVRSGSLHLRAASRRAAPRPPPTPL